MAGFLPFFIFPFSIFFVVIGDVDITDYFNFGFCRIAIPHTAMNKDIISVDINGGRSKLLTQTTNCMMMETADGYTSLTQRALKKSRYLHSSHNTLVFVLPSLPNINDLIATMQVKWLNIW